MAADAEILKFWFEEAGEAAWFKKDAAFDDELRRRFLDTYHRAAAGNHDDWQRTPLGCVALCLVLDQLPRNLFRDSPQAFATDASARAVTRRALKDGFDRAPGIDDHHRCFLYLPLEHSEDLDDQTLVVRLFRERTDNANYLDYAERHRVIIARFGRFPHRNAVLGRPSTEEERRFLEQPGSSF
ncbi:MAG: DUF924 family protein [Inquilinaceae bacterium]